MNDNIYELAESIIERAGAKKLTLATAESCTGGGIGAVLTEVPGASSAYSGGIIAYSNSIKNKLLDVPPGMIYKYGAVSNHVARLMAQNARQAFDTDIAVSVTGIAGPGGGSKEKPVGTVWIGLARDGVDTKTKRFLFKGQSRTEVQKSTILAALKLVEKAL